MQKCNQSINANFGNCLDERTENGLLKLGTMTAYKLSPLCKCTRTKILPIIWVSQSCELSKRQPFQCAKTLTIKMCFFKKYIEESRIVICQRRQSCGLANRTLCCLSAVVLLKHVMEMVSRVVSLNVMSLYYRTVSQPWTCFLRLSTIKIDMLLSQNNMHINKT